MTLYDRCMQELMKPDVMKMHKDYLSVLPVPAKAVILSFLLKKGDCIDADILRPILNSTIVALDLGECVVNDDVLSCLHVCKCLRKLDLTLRRDQDRRVTTEGLVSLFPHLKSLEILDLPYCKEFNDEVAQKICENCLDLKELCIPHSSITDHSIYLFGEHLKSLTTINILGTPVGDEGIEFLVTNPMFQALREININKCPKVTNAAHSIFLEKCQNVKIYSRGITITDDALQFALGRLLPPARGQKQMF